MKLTIENDLMFDAIKIRCHPFKSKLDAEIMLEKLINRSSTKYGKEFIENRLNTNPMNIVEIRDSYFLINTTRLKIYNEIIENPESYCLFCLKELDSDN